MGKLGKIAAVAILVSSVPVVSLAEEVDEVKEILAKAKSDLDKKLEDKKASLEDKAKKDRRKIEKKALKDRREKETEARKEKEPIITRVEKALKEMTDKANSEKEEIKTKLYLARHEKNLSKEEEQKLLDEADIKIFDIDVQLRAERRAINAKAREEKDVIEEELAKKIKPIEDKEEKDLKKVDEDLRKARVKAEKDNEKDKEKVEKLAEEIEDIEELKAEIDKVVNPEPEPVEEKRPPREPIEWLKTNRIAGQNRIATAIQLSKEKYEKADTVVLASQDKFADALPAAILAGSKDAPILLVGETLSEEVRAEIERLGAKKVYTVGGLGELEGLESLEVESIAGQDRYETSKLVAEEIFENTGKEERAVIANGEVFADALSACPLAIEEGIPILLVKKDEVTDHTKEALEDIEEVYIAGGKNAVSEKVEKELPKVIERFAGDNRFETAMKIAKASYKKPKKTYIEIGRAHV